jgi:hypothetical protein
LRQAGCHRRQLKPGDTARTRLSSEQIKRVILPTLAWPFAAAILEKSANVFTLVAREKTPRRAARVDPAAMLRAD